ncbi:hypothetical protein [Bifidobacterium aerophilum]|uniref:Sugar-binding protein n=1 Tax=Bifidobacterium aerophilum TaxID=1798155 RepID=A0A6N9Z346_9BIFI|nr:hypothetical protein [Bifidobacterium aerophilum]NEG89008.1 hypothetical protein [Bifidobacterium aerophilum]
MLNDEWEPNADATQETNDMTTGASSDGTHADTPSVPAQGLSFDAVSSPDDDGAMVDFTFPPIETGEPSRLTDIPTIAIPPITGTWTTDSPDGARQATMPDATDAEASQEAPDAAPTQIIGSPVNDGPRTTVIADGGTSVMPPVPPVPAPPQGLPLNPSSETDAAGTAKKTGAVAEPATDIIGSSNVIEASPEDFAEITQTGPIVAPEESRGDGDAANTRSFVFDCRFLIAGAAALVVAAVAVAGVFWWNGRQAEQTHAAKLVACQSAYSRYQDAADKVASVLKTTAAAQKITADQVADATTVTALKTAVDKANDMGTVSSCDANATLAALTSQTADANDAADKASELASSLTKAADAVTVSRTAKDDADRNAAKQQLQTAVADAQTLYDGTAGAVADESTRAALLTAIDTANTLLKEDKPTMTSLQDALKALQTASDDVNMSVEALTALNAQIIQNNGAQDTMPIIPQNTTNGTGTGADQGSDDSGAGAGSQDSEQNDPATPSDGNGSQGDSQDDSDSTGGNGTTPSTGQ